MSDEKPMGQVIQIDSRPSWRDGSWDREVREIAAHHLEDIWPKLDDLRTLKTTAVEHGSPLLGQNG